MADKYDRIWDRDYAPDRDIPGEERERDRYYRRRNFSNQRDFFERRNRAYDYEFPSFDPRRDYDLEEERSMSGHDQPYERYNYYGERRSRASADQDAPYHARRSRSRIDRADFEGGDYPEDFPGPGRERDEDDRRGRGRWRGSREQSRYRADYGRDYADDYDPYRDYNYDRAGSIYNPDPGSSRHYGVGPRGYQRSDERIHEDVNEHLMWDGAINAADIAVTVQDGEVTLEGTVTSRQQKRMAEDSAFNVRGVKDVHNRLRIADGQDQATGE